METLPLNFGNLSEHNVANAWRDFLEAAGALRVRLGNNAHLADRYIAFMLDGANSVFTQSAVAHGFNAGRDLYGLCQSIVNGDSEMRDHPFFQTASTYIEAHPLTGIEDHTKAWMHFVHLFGQYIERAAADFALAVGAEASGIADERTLTELHDQIVASLEGDKEALLEALVHRFKACYNFCTTLSLYLSGATYQLVEALSHRDKQTGRRAFQLLLDQQPR